MFFLLTKSVIPKYCHGLCISHIPLWSSLQDLWCKQHGIFVLPHHHLRVIVSTTFLTCTPVWGIWLLRKSGKNQLQ
jgi:hypothetical protein